jgi:lysozyme family protein
VPNFIIDPILGTKGGYVFDPSDMEPPTEKEKV